MLATVARYVASLNASEAHYLIDDRCIPPVALRYRSWGKLFKSFTADRHLGLNPGSWTDRRSQYPSIAPSILPLPPVPLRHCERRSWSAFPADRLASHRHTGEQSQQVESGMGAFCEPELFFLRIAFEKRRESPLPAQPNTPYQIHAQLALQALQGAISEIRFIEKNEMTEDEFRRRFSVLWDKINRVQHCLSNLNNSDNPPPTFLNN
jgi:hypothetical protein